MFREMRRFKQQLPEDECIRILEKQNAGVLALSGDDGYPYAVPVSYAYQDGKIYFHGAGSGHKIDSIARNNKVSFCVIDMNQVVLPEFTTYFRSVIVFGKIRILTDESERRAALEKIAVKFGPDDEQARRKEIEKTIGIVCLLELTVEHMTGKAAKELIRTNTHA